jgi:hypothetical protein
MVRQREALRIKQPSRHRFVIGIPDDPVTLSPDLLGKNIEIARLLGDDHHPAIASATMATTMAMKAPASKSDMSHMAYAFWVLKIGRLPPRKPFAAKTRAGRAFFHAPPLERFR